MFWTAKVTALETIPRLRPDATPGASAQMSVSARVSAAGPSLLLIAVVGDVGPALTARGILINDGVDHRRGGGHPEPHTDRPRHGRPLGYERGDRRGRRRRW